MCSYFFQHQPALIDDVSGKGRRELQGRRVYNKSKTMYSTYGT